MNSVTIYKSDYPNQVHQLSIPISQHQHLLKDGSIVWQKKPFDVKRPDFKNSTKRHLISFVITLATVLMPNCTRWRMRQKFKNSSTMPGGKRMTTSFWGAPAYLMIPAATQKQFLSLDNFFSNTDKVKLIAPGSGVQTLLASAR